MSSKVVRTWFREQIPLRVPSIPFFETINKEPPTQNLPSLWFTVEFTNPQEQRISLGERACWRETGQVGFVVLGRSGKGDDAVLDAAELIREAFRNSRPVLTVAPGEPGYLVIDGVEPPDTDVSESGNWFLASLSCPYTFDFVRGA